MTTQLTTSFVAVLVGTSWKRLVRKVRLKEIVKFEVHFVGYLHIMIIFITENKELKMCVSRLLYVS